MYIYVITNMVNLKKYVGCTARDNPIDRWNEHKRSTKSYNLYKAFNKYGIENFTFQVIDEYQSIDKMKESEKEYISLFNTFHGVGYNMTEGGDGRWGHITSEETKEKLRQANLGKKLSEEHKEKISKAGKGRIVSEETRKKLSLAHTGKKKNFKITNEYRQKLSDNSNRKRIIIQYDLDLNEINQYASLKQAEDETDIKYQSISRCCRGIRPTAGGYMWSYSEDKCPIRHNNKHKQVYQYTLQGVFVNKYNSTIDADKCTGVNNRGISSVCRNENKTAGGFIWRYA